MKHLIRSVLLAAVLFGMNSAVNAVQIVGGEVRVTVHSGLEFFLAGINLSLIPPGAEGMPMGTVLFPIVGGDTDTGVIELGGGVIFDDGGTNELRVTNFVITAPPGSPLTTTVDTSINNGPIETVLRSNNFICSNMPNTCFEPDRKTPINDPMFSGSFFSTAALMKFEEAFPGNTIDFATMLADVATVTSLQLVPLPAAAWLFVPALGLLGWRRRRTG